MRTFPRFGIVESEVLERHDEPVPSGEIDQYHAVEPRYNRTRPNVMSDGIDRMVILQRDSDWCLLNYTGSYTGRFVLTEGGVARVGESCWVTEIECPTG